MIKFTKGNKTRLLKMCCIIPMYILYLLQNNAQAQDTLKALPSNTGITFWGYADVYYAYDTNEPRNNVRNEMVNGNTHVYSHGRHNEFAINNAIIGLQYNKDKVRGAFAMHTGTYVQANYASEPALLKNIYEAYAGYNVAKRVWIDAGIFTSHIGAESALSFDNLTLSRSIMADNTPYFETGVKATYEVKNKLTLTGLVLNGWQNIQDNNKNKAVGTQIQYKPTKNILLNSSTFYGKEAGAYENTSALVSTDSLSTQRFFHNFFAQINFGKKLTVLGAFDIGIQKKRNAFGNYMWYNPNLIVKYRLTDVISFAGRVEYYHDKNGVIIYSGTPNGFQTVSYSLNIDFKLTDSLLWRIEGRTFDSKDAVYVKYGSATHTDGIMLTSLALKF
jgi:hypothetical protein